MAQPYPISRQSREQAVELGSGVATYGPFNFKIFDIEDVEVWTQPVTGVVWTLASVTVAKTSGAALDTFSITFASAITAATRYKVLGKRVYERSAGVTKGTRLDPDALEKELSKIAATLQELRRDAGRGIQVQFGDGYILSDSLADGATLMKSGSRIVEGPSAAEIEAAQGYATAAGNSALAASISAAAAATFNPANFYSRTESDERYYTKTAADALLAGKVAFLASGAALPASNIGPIWHADYNAIMTWQAFSANGASFTGYASTDIGAPRLDGRNSPRAGWLKRNGASYSKTTYAALWNWALHNGLVVALGSWAAGAFVFADNGDGTFKLPDSRGEFERNWDDGRGVDSGRAFGSSQLDQLQGFQIQISKAASATSNTAMAGSSPTGSFNNYSPVADGTNGTPRTGSETRPRNVALLGTIKF